MRVVGDVCGYVCAGGHVKAGLHDGSNILIQNPPQIMPDLLTLNHSSSSDQLAAETADFLNIANAKVSKSDRILKFFVMDEVSRPAASKPITLHVRSSQTLQGLKEAILSFLIANTPSLLSDDIEVASLISDGTFSELLLGPTKTLAQLGLVPDQTLVVHYKLGSSSSSSSNGSGGELRKPPPRSISTITVRVPLNPQLLLPVVGG